MGTLQNKHICGLWMSLCMKPRNDSESGTGRATDHELVDKSQLRAWRGLRQIKTKALFGLCQFIILTRNGWNAIRVVTAGPSHGRTGTGRSDNLGIGPCSEFFTEFLTTDCARGRARSNVADAFAPRHGRGDIRHSVSCRHSANLFLAERDPIRCRTISSQDEIRGGNRGYWNIFFEQK